MAAVRLDKWLWAARFFKTRSQATAAVDAGRVCLPEQRTKPAHPVTVGDILLIKLGDANWEIEVLALSEQRGGAQQAQSLYRETEASLKQRQVATEQRRLVREPSLALKGRPTKRDRRLLERWRE